MIITLDVNLETGKAKILEVQKDDFTVTYPVVIVEPNRLRLNKLAIEMLGLVPNDKVTINFCKEGDMLIPIIGKSEYFGLESGNKLTKSGTISCRGIANETISKYGTEFTLKLHSDNIYQLVNTNLAEDEKEDLDIEEILDAAEYTEINYDLGENSKPEDFNVDFDIFKL